MQPPSEPLDAESTPTEESLRGQTLTTSRGTLKLWRGGGGEPIVLIHDLGASYASFHNVVPHLVGTHQLCAVDLLGHGGSSRDAPDLSVAAQATALEEALTDMGLENIVLVGHSLGGSVALRVAASIPDRVTKLVLLASGSYAQELPWIIQTLRVRSVWNGAALLGPRARKWCAARACGRRGELAAELDTWDSVKTGRGWKELGRAFRQSTSHEAISEMEALVERYFSHPALVLWGSEDAESSPTEARVLFQQKRSTRFVEIAGGTHVLHEDHPRIVAEMIQEFLE